MKPSNHTVSQHKRRSRALWHTGALVFVNFGLCFPSSLLAQSASNFDTTRLAPKISAAEKGKASNSAPKEAGPVNATPSRYISDEEVLPYVQSIAASLAIRQRTTDPFGQLQDPNAKPIIKPTLAKKSQRVTQMQSTPFVDIIRQIKVSTIMPLEKKFLVGTRSIKQGQQFPISYRNKNIKIEVVSVSSRQIEFRNVDSGEIAALKLSLLPAGMTPGNKGITAPGMQQNLSDAPLEIEGGGISTDKAQTPNP